MENRSDNSLLILVTSDRYFEYVESLTLAALEKGKAVRIHIWGEGVGFIKTAAFRYLARRAWVSICAASLSGHTRTAGETLPVGVDIVQPENTAEVFKQSSRHMVF